MTGTSLRPTLAALTVVALLFPGTLSSQGPGAFVTDASLPARGAFRLRVYNEWTRYDAIFGNGGGTGSATRPLGSLLATNALGSRELPALASTDAALQALTGDPGTRVSLGAMSSTANTRIVRTPLGLDYGVTDRISIGVTLPVVQTRSLLVAQLNELGAGGNVGVNPNDVALSTQVYDAFASAATSIEQALSQCATNPTAPVCARPSEATALMRSTRAFAAAVQRLYGTTGGAGQPFVPFANDPTFAAIQQYRQALSLQYESFFGSGITAPDLPGGGATVALDQLQAFLRGEGMGTRRDSIGIVERLGVGDVELSAAFQPVRGLVDSGAVGSRGARALVQFLVRLPTGFPPQYGLPFEAGTGGRFDIEGRAALDVRVARRVALSVAGQFTLAVGERRIPFVVGTWENPFAGGWPSAGTWKPGPYAQAFITPRVALTDFLRLDLHYGFIRRGSDHYTFDPAVADADLAAVPDPGSAFDLPATIEHRAGIGFSYRMPEVRVRDGAGLPIEIAYTHLESVAASGGVVPKATVDQLQFRLYLQIFGR